MGDHSLSAYGIGHDCFHSVAEISYELYSIADISRGCFIACVALYTETRGVVPTARGVRCLCSSLCWTVTQNTYRSRVYSNGAGNTKRKIILHGRRTHLKYSHAYMLLPSNTFLFTLSVAVGHALFYGVESAGDRRHFDFPAHI